MTIVDDLLASARVLVLQPGDMVVLESPRDINKESAARIKERLREHPALADHDILIVGGGQRLTAVRPAQ